MGRDKKTFAWEQQFWLKILAQRERVAEAALNVGIAEWSLFIPYRDLHSQIESETEIENWELSKLLGGVAEPNSSKWLVKLFLDQERMSYVSKLAFCIMGEYAGYRAWKLR